MPGPPPAFILLPRRGGGQPEREGSVMHLEPRRPGSTPAPHPAQTRAPSSSSLPTRQRVGRKTSGPRQRGFWQRGDKRSVETGGPLWMPFPLHLGWRQCGPRNPGAAPLPSCNGTSRVFRGVWPLDPQSKGFYAGNWRAWSSGGPASDCPVVELRLGVHALRCVGLSGVRV